MTRWEYRQFIASMADDEATRLDMVLEEMGAAGWECFAVDACNEWGGRRFWLKRPLEAR